MPELPDVEGFRRELADHLPGRVVRRVHVLDAGVLNGITAPALGRRLHGRRFAAPQRHGKWLILPTDHGSLLVHSGMTGHPYYAGAGAPPERYERVIIELDQGELRYSDLRKLRGIWFAEDGDALGEIVGEQGPDALSIDRAGFVDAIAARRGRLKPVLTDQAVLAGLGNMLADEICWRARINPANAVESLTVDELSSLHRSMRSVLRTSVRHGCIPHFSGWITTVRRVVSARCPRCETPLHHTRIGGRGTVWCPHCQLWRG